jgi:hypothetical protein
MTAPWALHQPRMHRTLEYLNERPDKAAQAEQRWPMFKAYLDSRGVLSEDPASNYVGLTYLEMMLYWGKVVLASATNKYTAAQWGALTDMIIYEFTCHMAQGLPPTARLEMGLPIGVDWDDPSVVELDLETDDDDDDDDGEDDDENVG